MKKNLITLFIFFIIIIFFTIAALIPRNLINFTPYGGDDLAHVYIFMSLSFLLCFYRIIHKVYIYLILFLYGLLIEILQLMVGRSFSYLDISYNFIGIGMGIVFYFFFIKRFNDKQ